MLDKVEAVVTPVLSDLGYRLVDLEYVSEHGRWILRLYIERAEGAVSVGDCEAVSRAVSGVLDVEDVIPHRYDLEVSSPGLNRPLRVREDFERFKGEKIRLKTVRPVDGRSNYYGTLVGMEGDDIVMNVDGIDYKIPITVLAKARLEYK